MSISMKPALTRGQQIKFRQIQSKHRKVKMACSFNIADTIDMAKTFHQTLVQKKQLSPNCKNA
jgi:hypothetical protein